MVLTSSKETLISTDIRQCRLYGGFRYSLDQTRHGISQGLRQRIFMDFERFDGSFAICICESEDSLGMISHTDYEKNSVNWYL
jgi:hypothetical protein